MRQLVPFNRSQFPRDINKNYIWQIIEHFLFSLYFTGILCVLVKKRNNLWRGHILNTEHFGVEIFYHFLNT